MAERKAFAWGLFPAPLVDIAAVATLQLGMIRDLAALYGVPYKRSLARAIVVTIAGGLFPTSLGATFAYSIVKRISWFGPLVGAAVVPASVGGATRLMGLLMTQHFELGGTLDDFDLRSIPKRFRRSAAGEETPAARKAEGTPKTPTTASNTGTETPTASDDLTVIRGVGKKIESLLQAASIHTFADLAVTKVDDIEAILLKAGSRYHIHDPTSWPKQAKLASEQRWAELKDLCSTLD